MKKIIKTLFKSGFQGLTKVPADSEHTEYELKLQLVVFSRIYSNTQIRQRDTGRESKREKEREKEKQLQNQQTSVRVFCFSLLSAFC